jgi:hypothetical protein
MRHQKSNTDRNTKENTLPVACVSVLVSGDLALESTVDALTIGTNTYGHGCNVPFQVGSLERRAK